jgi:hypothetical protein
MYEKDSSSFVACSSVGTYDTFHCVESEHRFPNAILIRTLSYKLARSFTVLELTKVVPIERLPFCGE